MQIEALQPRLLMSATAALERLVQTKMVSSISMPATGTNVSHDSAADASAIPNPVATPASLLPYIPPSVATPAAATPDPVTGTTTALSVLGSDALGESILLYGWAATNKPTASNPRFSVNNTNAAKNATVTFDQPGNYTFTCTITGTMGLRTQSSVNVTVLQTLSTIAIQPGPPAMADRTSYPFKAVAADQFGNSMSTQPVFNWSIDDGGAEGTISSTGMYSAPATATGLDRIRASSGGIIGTAAVSITGDGIFDGDTEIGSPALSGYFSDNAGTYTVGGAGVSSGGSDQLEFPYRSLAGDAALVADVTAVSGTSDAGTAGIEFRESPAPTSAYIAITRNGPSGSDEIGLEVRTAAGGTTSDINLISAPGAAWLRLVRSGNHFTAWYGTNGVAWTQLGSTSTLAIGDAMLGGLVVSSNSATMLSQGTFADVSIGAAVAVGQPASVNPNGVTASSANLSILGVGEFGESGLTYTWAATAQPSAGNPQFSINGTNAAKNTTVTFNQAGDYTFTCTISDGLGAAVNSSVNVTVAQTLTTLALSPSSTTVFDESTRQFSATALDQFNNAMPAPALVWSVSAGAGSVDNNGLYTAADSPGNATVTAASGAVSANAGVTIAKQPPTVVITATASPNVVTGTSAALSVLGADDRGESDLSYTWSLIETPPAPVVFLINGTNSAKNDTAIFSAAGVYDLLVTITDPDGATTGSSLVVNVYHVAHTPSVTGAWTLPSTPTSGGLVITPSPLDGPAQGFYLITNISGGGLFQHDGMTQIRNGQFITFAQGLAGLVFNPVPNSTANGNFTVRAAGVPNVASLVASPITATIAVLPVAHVPTVSNAVSIEGEPTSSGLVITPNPADAGKPVEFQVTQIIGGSLFQSDGMTPIHDGDFITAAQGRAGLKFRPDLFSPSPAGFDVQASLTATFGGLGGDIVAAKVRVIPPSPPLIGNPATQAVPRGAALVFSYGKGNAITVSNADGGVQDISLTSSNGTLTLPTHAGITLIGGIGTRAPSIRFFGLPAAINAALNGLTFTPRPGYIGAANVLIAAVDAQSVVLGNPLSAASSFAVSILPQPVGNAATLPPLDRHPRGLGASAMSFISRMQAFRLTTNVIIAPVSLSEFPPVLLLHRDITEEPDLHPPAMPMPKANATPAAPVAVSPPPVLNAAPFIPQPVIPVPTEITKTARIPLRANRQFIRDLDLMRQQADFEHQRLARIFTSTATLASAALSLMYLVRTIRARSILKSFVASMHHWKVEDPFAVLDRKLGSAEPAEREREDEDARLIIQPQRRRAALNEHTHLRRIFDSYL